MSKYVTRMYLDTTRPWRDRKEGTLLHPDTADTTEKQVHVDSHVSKCALYVVHEMKVYDNRDCPHTTTSAHV